MTTHTSTHSPIKNLRANIIEADDQQITKIVTLLDQMTHRGAADALLAPLRSRLMLLRPLRPLSLTRLLFLPVDPIIVSAPNWRRAALTIPRTALAPIADQIRQAIGSLAIEIDAGLEGRDTQDRKLILNLGAKIWKFAAAALTLSVMPPNWTSATGLAELDYVTIARALAVLLRQGHEIESMETDGILGLAPDAASIRACLGSTIEVATEIASSLGARPVGMLLAILLAKLPNADLLITTAGDLAAAMADPAARQAADKAIDFILDGIESSSGLHEDLTLATEEQNQIAALLNTLEGSGPASRPVRKLRATKLRRQLDTSARNRFNAEMASRVLAPAGTLSVAATDTEVNLIENAARDLRRFEAASRALGGSDHYDRVLKECSRALADTPAIASNRTDIARLVEILQGPEAALAIFCASAT